MENQDKMRIMKPRSARMVLAKGFRLYAENIRRLLKASWITALIYALSCGALGTVAAIKLPEMTTTLMQLTALGETLTEEAAWMYIMTMGGILLLLLLTIVTYGMAAGMVLNKLKEHKETDVITIPPSWLHPNFALTWRSIKGMLLTVFVMLLPTVFLVLLLVGLGKLMPETMQHHYTTITGTAVVLLAIIVVLELPLTYVWMKYILEPATRFWKILWPAYVRGLRHWAQIFTVVFISMLLVCIFVTIFMMPANILYIANEQAHAGLLIGDELGMPSYIVPLTFATFTLSNLMGFYVGQLTTIHIYYLYGNIEYRSQEER